MQTKELIGRVEQMALPLCEQAGVSLWDVEFEKEGGQYMLTITIDREGGVDIDPHTNPIPSCLPDGSGSP